MERRRFTREFKVEAVKLVRERGVAVVQAARDPQNSGKALVGSCQIAPINCERGQIAPRRVDLR